MRPTAVESTRRLIGDAISRGVLPLGERARIQERLQRLVAEESDPVLGLCQSCSSLAASAIEKEYAWYQHEIGMLVKEEFTVKEDVNIFGILDESDAEMRDQIRRARQELQSFSATYADLSAAMDAAQRDIDGLTERGDALLTDLNTLEALREDLCERVRAAADLTGSAERELRMLHTMDSVPLFYISASSGTPLINGFELTLYPPRGSSFADINAAWALVGLAVSSVIGLRLSYDQAALAPDMNYKLTPLRNRVILRRIKYIKMTNIDAPNAFLGPVLSLEGGVSETYLEAIAALLVLLASVARKLNRPDALVGSVRRVLDTVDKYGADVASSSFGGGFRHSSKVSGSPSSNGLELLPHWRYLFSSSTNMIEDLMKSLQLLL